MDVEENNEQWDEDIVNKLTEEIFRAFADNTIPQSPDLADRYGRIQYYGALDFETEQFMVMSLNSFPVPLAVLMAEVINKAAEQFLYGQREIRSRQGDAEYFIRLSQEERHQALAPLFSQGGINYFPVQEEISQEEIFPVFQSLVRMAFMGYYSEWWGYGETRLNPPNERTLEYYPLSWRQIGYPGPSLGYRVARSYVYT